MCRNGPGVGRCHVELVVTHVCGSVRRIDVDVI
jgi:hypothetical protein